MPISQNNISKNVDELITTQNYHFYLNTILILIFVNYYESFDHLWSKLMDSLQKITAPSIVYSHVYYLYSLDYYLKNATT